MALPRFLGGKLGFLQFSNAGVHALGHVFIFGVLWLGHEQELQFQLSDPVGSLALSRGARSASVALHAVDRPYLLGRPFVEARHVHRVGFAERLVLMFLEAYVRPSKAAILGHQVVKQIPRRGLRVSLARLCVQLLLLRGSFGLFLLLQLELLSLLGGGEHAAESRRFLGLGDFRGGFHHLSGFGLFEFGLQGQLELQVVEDDELKLLADGSVLPELKPCRGYAVQAIIQC